MQKRMISLFLAILLCMTVMPITTSMAYNVDSQGRMVYNGHTYLYCKDSKSWENAKDYCESQGGHLATITSAGEQEAIFQYIQDAAGDTDIWIGFYDADAEGDWSVWITGEPISYTNWGTGEPDDAFGGQDYGVICNGKRSGSGYSIAPGEWDDVANASRPFLCEWDYALISSDWSSPEIEEAYQAGLIPEQLLDDDLTEPVNRAEFAAIAVSLYESLTDTSVSAVSTPFTDIAGSEFASDIAKAYGLNVTVGVTDTTFSPAVSINREQLATMLCRTVKKYAIPEWTYDTDGNYYLDTLGVEKFSDDAQISDFARQSVYYMAKFGVIQGYSDGTFRPKNSASQEEAAVYSNATKEQALVMSLRIFRLQDVWKEIN